MEILGQYNSPIERVKAVLVDELKAYFRLQRSIYALSEKPNIAKYGVLGDTDAVDDSAVQISTALPHEEQRVPRIVLLSCSGVEKKMGLGKQVIKTFHHPISGLPMYREVVGMDITATFEITAGDTNTRSQLEDHLFSFFGQYSEDTNYMFLGAAEVDALGDQNLYQIISQSRFSFTGESDVPRPEGEGFERLYQARATAPFLFLDYTDREAWDIDVLFNPDLQPPPDPNNRFPLGPPTQFQFAKTDDFENWTGTGWAVITNAHATGSTTANALNGNVSWIFEEPEPSGAGLLLNLNSGIVSGKARVRYSLDTAAGNVIIACMLQSVDANSQDPFVDASYHLIVHPGVQTRMQLMKGPIGSGVEIAKSSVLTVPVGGPGCVQLQWRVDVPLQRILLQAAISPYTLSFQDVRQRLEFVDTDSPFLTSMGEGVGFIRDEKADPNDLSSIRLDDIEILNGIG